MILKTNKPFFYAFSRLNMQTDFLYDLIRQKSLSEKDFKDIETILLSLKNSLKKILLLEIEEKEWKNIRVGNGTTWIEYKGSLTKKIIPAVIQILEKILKEKKNIKEIHFDILRERVNLLKESIFGISSSSAFN